RRIDLLLRMYQNYLEDEKYHSGGYFNQDALDYLSVAPAPVEINALVQAAVRFEKHPHTYEVFSLFVTRLIQNSYTQGHNNFVITNDLPNILWDFFGGELCGKEERPLHLEMDGNVCDGFFHLAKYVHVRLDGDIRGECGKQSEFSSFEITGSVGSCAERARNSIYTLNAIRKSNYRIEEEPVECTFRTPNEQIIPRLLAGIPAGNRIVYVQKDGTEKMMRNYDD
ncbi:MAG TPA: hypothetical protein VJI32_04915, partial [Candidatus Nanoarchaeia archaeon]|nr:hypothetical protein [Candidatus Nanoarchaeia archaeon]